MRQSLRFLAALVGTNIKASLALRGAFWARVFFMFVNNFIFLVIFAVYPSTIFRGWLKVVLYTAIPAGFVTYLPVTLLREFSWPRLGAILGAAVVYAGIAVLVFGAGLRRYASGSRFGVRA